MMFPTFDTLAGLRAHLDAAAKELRAVSYAGTAGGDQRALETLAAHVGTARGHLEIALEKAETLERERAENEAATKAVTDLVSF